MNRDYKINLTLVNRTSISHYLMYLLFIASIPFNAIASCVHKDVCICVCINYQVCDSPHSSFSRARGCRPTLVEDGGEWRRTFSTPRSFVYFSPETMQWRGDGHQIGRQGSTVAPARQSQSPALHVPIDFNRFNDMDVQAPPLEVPPWNWSGCHLRWESSAIDNFQPFLFFLLIHECKYDMSKLHKYASSRARVTFFHWTFVYLWNNNMQILHIYLTRILTLRNPCLNFQFFSLKLFFLLCHV